MLINSGGGNVNFRALCALALLIAPIISLAKGPVGIGKLEIGMPRSAVEGLAESDGVHLSSPLTPYEYKKTEPTPGEDKFDTTLVSPLSEKPLKAVLTFSDSGLKSIFVELGESSRDVDRVKDLISAKYGEPKVENSMKEEQCVYKNGANFKVSSGIIKHSWNQERQNAEPISTSLAFWVFEMCPSNLRYGMGAVKAGSLSIGVLTPEKPVVNPF